MFLVLSGNITAHFDTRLLSFGTGRGESKPCSRENVLLWKIILQNILVHTRIIKIQMLNCYCQLSSSVIFRQYGVSQSECRIDRPRPGLPRLSPRPHTEAMVLPQPRTLAIFSYTRCTATCWENTLVLSGHVSGWVRPGLDAVLFMSRT
jgi:hypothetical protein